MNELATQLGIDTKTVERYTDLLEKSFAKIPKTIKRVYIRADKGFYDHDIIDKIETKIGCQFAIAAKLTSPVKKRLSSLRYHTVSQGIQTAEFLYQPIVPKGSLRELEKAVSIRCYPTTNTGRSFRSTNPIFCRQIQLPSDRNKYATEADKHLAIL